MFLSFFPYLLQFWMSILPSPTFIQQASTVLFKMDRCELEISKAAQRARQFLDHFEEADERTPKIKTPDGDIAAAAGIGSAKKMEA